jgi:hypothetical protein
LCLALVVALYVHQFFVQGGIDHVSPDGEQYLSLLGGSPPGWPKNVRVLQPGLAFLISTITGLSFADGFRLLTPLELLLSTVLLWHLLRRRGASVAWQAANILVVGCPLAVLFGHAPVLVDPLLLLLACGLIVALDHARLGIGLLFVCLAVITKEYGIVLAVPWAVSALRMRSRAAALGGFLVPCILSVALKVLAPRQHIPDWAEGQEFFGMGPFIRGSLGYHPSLFRELGPATYLKTTYIWLWALGWPFFLLAIAGTIRRLAAREALGPDLQRFFALFVVSWPLLLIADSDRAILFVVPFACLAATTHALTRNQLFVWVVALGGVATALARPAYYVISPPRVIVTAMIGLSLAASGLVLASCILYWFRRRQTDGSPMASCDGPGTS